MTKEHPYDDTHSKSDTKPTKGTNEPWKKPGQASQNTEADIAKPDLENWQDSKTH